MRPKERLTIYATEVKEVGSAVHLVELKAHLSLHGSDGVLPSHTQIVRIDHLQVFSKVSKRLSDAAFVTDEERECSPSTHSPTAS